MVKITGELEGTFFHSAIRPAVSRKWTRCAVFKRLMRACIGIYVAEKGDKVYNKISVRQYFRRQIMLLKMG